MSSAMSDRSRGGDGQVESVWVSGGGFFPVGFTVDLDVEVACGGWSSGNIVSGSRLEHGDECSASVVDSPFLCSLFDTTVEWSTTYALK